MNIHIDPANFLIGWLIASGVAIAIRGIIGSTRRYSLVDSVFGVVEVALLIWLVTAIR